MTFSASTSSRRDGIRRAHHSTAPDPYYNEDDDDDCLGGGGGDKHSLCHCNTWRARCKMVGFGGDFLFKIFYLVLFILFSCMYGAWCSAYDRSGAR